MLKVIVFIGESKQERLCLSVLKELHRIPEIGYNLVPEHVETRSLYRNDRPGVEQVGHKLNLKAVSLMWTCRF